MSDEPMTEELPERPGRVAPIVIAILFAALFAYPLFQAISNLISLPPLVGGRTPWWLLIVAIVLPVALYVAALLLGRGRVPFVRAMLLAAALAAANALTLSGIAVADLLLS